METLIENEPNLIANLANIAAILSYAFDFFWVEFYLVKENELVLGPFQGPVPAHVFRMEKAFVERLGKSNEQLSYPTWNNFQDTSPVAANRNLK